MASAVRDPSDVVPVEPGDLPAEVRSCVGYLVADMQLHLSVLIDEEKSERRREVAALRQEHQAAMAALRGELQQSTPGEQSDLEASLRKLSEEVFAQKSLQDERFSELTKGLHGERSSRKALLGEIQQSVMAEVTTAFHKPLLEERLEKVERSTESLKVELDRKALDVDSSLRKSEAQLDRMQQINASAEQLQQQISTRERELLKPQQAQPPHLDVPSSQLDPQVAPLEGDAEKGLGPLAVVVAGEALEEAAPELEKTESYLKHGPSKLDEDVEFEVSYTFQESTWDALLYVGLSPNIGIGDDLLLILAWLVGMTVQAVFIGIVLSSLIPDALSDSTLKGLIKWRLYNAHDASNYDELTNTSLLHRVCDGSSSLQSAEQQNSLHASISGFLVPGGPKYLQTITDGRTLCTLCIALWTLSILKEFQMIFQFTRVLWRAPSRGETQLDQQEDGIELVSMNRTRSLMLTLAVVIPRIAIAVVLFQAGVNFLMYTVDLGDLLLNALALTFIVDIDDLLYEVLVPASVKGLQDTMKPVVLSTLSKREGTNRCVDRTALISFVALFIAVGYIVTFQFRVFVNRIETAKSILCDGDWNFVYTIEKGTAVVHMTDVTPASANLSGISAYAAASIFARTGLAGSMEPEIVQRLAVFASDEGDLWYNSSISEILYMETQSQQEANNQHACKDVTTDEARMRASRTSLTYLLSMRAENCSDLVHYCDTQRFHVRAICPVTCGCNTVMAGIFNIEGCTSVCEVQRRNEVSRIAEGEFLFSGEFFDANASNNLSTNTTWNTYWEGMRDHLSKEGELAEVLDALTDNLGTTIDDLINATISYGCDMASYMKEYTFFDPCCMQNCNFGTVAMFCPSTCGLTKTPGQNMAAYRAVGT